MARRTLGLDLGERRVGLALSDPLGVTAQPLCLLERTGTRALEDEVVRRAVEHDVERVVVGYPLLLSGKAGGKAAEAESFARSLGRRLAGVEIVLWDERLTTAAADRAMRAAGLRRERRRQAADVLAAVLILQTYLDARRARAERRPYGDSSEA